METLKLSMMFGALALYGGCIGTSSGKDTGTSTSTSTDSDADSDSDADGDADTDTDSDSDTSGNYAALFWKGSLDGNGDKMSGGKYGFAFYPYDFNSDLSDLTAEICHAWVDLEEGAPIALACDNCEYSYSATATTTGGESGDCTSLADAGVTLASEAVMTKYFGKGGTYEEVFGAGYSSATQYGFAGIYMYQEAYADTYGWFLFGYHAPDQNAYATSNNYSMEWVRPIRDRDTKYEVYYSL